MINQAFTQWSEHPVITTLETISAPIDTIQFPTVTVCDQKPADNWGPIEKVLNSLAFECSSPTSNCKESTKEIRKDFKFLIAALVKLCLELLNEIDYKVLEEAPMFKNEIAHYKNFGTTDIVEKIIRQGKYKDLIDIAIQKFATNTIHNSQYSNSAEIKDFFAKDYTTDSFLNCTTDI